MILPGATLGMLGGGQLGRMFTIAARTMGYHVIVLDPDPDSPAGRIADEHLHAGYRDDWALAQIADQCAAVTTEFENIPADSLAFLEKHLPVRPSSNALRATQNRIREKTLIRDIGLQTAEFATVTTPSELEEACARIPAPCLLKRASSGYDGKGQSLVHNFSEALVAFQKFDQEPCVLESKVNLACEISVVLARSSNGDICYFPVAENQHSNGILAYSIVPARVDEKLAEQARQASARLAETLDYCGVMAVEFFVTDKGELLVNEIAPRPHNSGHYTLDACSASQFEQQVRMVCDLPAAHIKLNTPVVMANLLGDVWGDRGPAWQKLFAHQRVKLHLYGKREARPGRKMGHFCYLDDDAGQALTMSRTLIDQLHQS